jgi:hypothetical protein
MQQADVRASIIKHILSQDTLVAHAVVNAMIGFSTGEQKVSLFQQALCYQCATQLKWCRCVHIVLRAISAVGKRADDAGVQRGYMCTGCWSKGIPPTWTATRWNIRLRELNEWERGGAG